MPFLLLLVITFACLPVKWPEPPAWLGPGGCALLTLAGTLLLMGLAGLLSRTLSRQVARHPEQRSLLVRRYTSWKFYYFLILLSVYGYSLYALGWVATVRSLPILGVKAPPGVELLILVPFLLPLLFSWAVFYNVERAIHDSAPKGSLSPPEKGSDRLYLGGQTPFREESVRREATALPGRASYVGVQVQHNLILAFPPVLLMVLQEVIRQFVPGMDLDWLTPLLSLGLIAVLFMTLPWMLRLLLCLKPLPDGPLRERLLAAARRLKFRCNDILVWNTRNGIANAMVTGLLPCLRYVVVTDRLTRDLTPDEVEAVFGHEVGHVKHHHLLYYCVFLLTSMFVMVGVLVAAGIVSVQAESAAQAPEVASQLPLLGVLVAYVFIVFGFLSRRCERQADIYGCRAVSCELPFCTGHDTPTTLVPQGRGLCATGIRLFIDALEKVARVNGISRDRPGWLSSWQHSTIARRVEFLQKICSDPYLEPRFQRRVVLVKWGLLLGLGVVFLTVVLVLGPEGMRHLWQSL
jgi:STE24 endopeptidase